MRIRIKPPHRRDENLVPLINIVFLLLVFFLAASALKPFASRGITPPETRLAEADARPRQAVLVDVDGRILVAGQEVSLDGLGAALASKAAGDGGDGEPLRIVADRSLAAHRLLDIVAAAGAAGVRDIRLITLRGDGP